MNTVTFEKRNRIAYITLNRPGALNALDDELNDVTLRRAPSPPRPRLLVTATQITATLVTSATAATGSQIITATTAAGSNGLTFAVQ